LFKKILNISLLLLIAICASGQQAGEDFFYVDPDDDDNLDLGIRMGYALNTFGGDMFAKPIYPILRLTGAVYHRIPLSKKSKTSIYYELGGSFKGAKFKQPGDSAIERLALIYMDLPIGLDFKLKEVKNELVGGKPSIWRLFVGFQTSILLHSTLFTNQSDRIGREFGLPLQRMDYAFVIGVPYEFPVGYGKMGVATYIKYGLINIDNGLEKYKPSPNFTSGSTVNNLQLSFNITF
jgi:hypothetical protein